MMPPSSGQKLEAVRSPETLVSAFKSTRMYKLADRHLHPDRRKNLRSREALRICLRCRSVAGFFDHGNALSVSVKARHFLDSSTTVVFSKRSLLRSVQRCVRFTWTCSTQPVARMDTLLTGSDNSLQTSVRPFSVSAGDPRRPPS